MTAQIIPFPLRARCERRRPTTELDVIARRCGQERDLVDQVGTLFIDHAEDGSVEEVTFQPAYERLANAIIRVTTYGHRGDHVEVRDADNGSRWVFEVYDLDFFVDGEDGEGGFEEADLDEGDSERDEGPDGDDRKS